MFENYFFVKDMLIVWSLGLDWTSLIILFTRIISYFLWLFSHIDFHFPMTFSWHTSNKDINMKLSGYLPWGEIRSSMTSGMTMSSKSPVRNPQRPPSTPMNDPHSWHNFNKNINTKLSGYLPLGQTRSSMTSWMTSHRAKGPPKQHSTGARMKGV